MSMTERLFGTKASHAPAQKVAKGIILSEWPQKKEELSAEQAKKAAERSTGTLPPAAKPGEVPIDEPANACGICSCARQRSQESHTMPGRVA